MRTGGTAKALRQLTIWITTISILVIFLALKFAQKKENYQKLYQKVGELDFRVTSLEGNK
jgi:preprotein translocase subunit SecG